jgi:AcrR family transcriptional regulator
MSNKTAVTVREAWPTDPRVRRSVHALGVALVELMHEREFDRITVQDILDRAGVGRATFYAHYRNKDDVLYSGYERMFAHFEQSLDRRSPGRVRLVPVAELLTHFGEADPFIGSLRESGRLDEMWALGVDFLADMIERGITPVPGAAPAVPRSLVARMLAGALMEMMRWWLEHRESSTPEEMDGTFHALARTTLLRAAYVSRGP